MQEGDYVSVAQAIGSKGGTTRSCLCPCKQESKLPCWCSVPTGMDIRTQFALVTLAWVFNHFVPSS